MDLEKLKALIRLANNNPNDNEANLAARRVCREIAKDDFRLFRIQTIRTAADKINQHKSNYAGGVGTWNDVRRSTEPEFRSRQTGPASDDAFNDLFNRMRNSGFRRRDGKSWFDDAPEVDRSNEPPWDSETEKAKWARPFYQGEPVQYDAEGKRIKKQEFRKCAKCGLEIMTYRITEDPWICNMCHWKEV